MADYSITEVVIDGVPVRVGDRIRFAYDRHGTVRGIIIGFDDGPLDDDDDGPQMCVQLLPCGDNYLIADMANLVVLANDALADPDEREAIVTEHHRTAWDRVLDGEGTP